MKAQQAIASVCDVYIFVVPLQFFTFFYQTGFYMHLLHTSIYIHIYFFPFSGVIDDAPLRFRGEVYHGYHFNCTSCGVELDSTAREVKSRPGLTANDMVKFR